MSLEELSRILAMTGISTSPEAYILTSFRSLSTSSQPQGNFEVSFEETKESCTKSDGEHLVKPDIGEFSSCLWTNPVCIPETNCPSFPSMIEEDFEIGPNEEGSQDHHDYIEHSFQITIQSNYHSHLQILFVSHLSKLLVFHARIPFKVFSSNLSMNISLYLFRTWLHWKYSYTWRRSFCFFK